MLFNSIDFAIFLPIVFILYWLLNTKKLKLQNLLLLLASYFFYACWDWRFLFLLIFSTALDFYTGQKVALASGKHRKQFWLWLSIAINLGFLGFFKYFNFFIDSFVDALALLGWQAHPNTLNIILPVGISFYTFHGLSYVIDIYRDKIKAERDPVSYALFVGFFPLLVAGPIERATHLLPQIKRKRKFNYGQAVDGLKQILWGLFKKMVIADNCAEYVNLIFSQPSEHTASTLLLGGILFAFQIYGDFSGYSDIALGVARLFGIELLRNFSYPYFSRDIAEFWRRWHISLSSWFRDYLYIPLGGSKGGTWMKIRNTFIIFIVSGFWHGANWTFVAWGFINAVYFLPLLLTNNNRNHIGIIAEGKKIPSFRELISMMVTFGLTVIAWIFFRAENITHAFEYLKGMFSFSIFSIPNIPGKRQIIAILMLIVLLLWIEWKGRMDDYALKQWGIDKQRWKRWFLYIFILFLIVMFLKTDDTPFIYFQF